MTAQENEERLAELARLGNQVYFATVLPKLRPEDNENFVAVDIDSGEFEVDPFELAAIDRLRARRPAARVWLMQAGYDSAYRIRRQPEVRR